MGPKRKTRIKLEKNNNNSGGGGRTSTSGVRDRPHDPDLILVRNNVPIRKRSYDPKNDPLEIEPKRQRVDAPHPKSKHHHPSPEGARPNGAAHVHKSPVGFGHAHRFQISRDVKDKSLKVTLSKETKCHPEARHVDGAKAGHGIETKHGSGANGERDGSDKKRTGAGAHPVQGRNDASPVRPVVVPCGTQCGSDDDARRRARESEPDDVVTQRRAFDSWCQDTYGEHSRSKTVTLKKHARVVRALRGAADEDTSKFRFWVRAKGFRIDVPDSYTRTPADKCVDGKLRADPALFIPDKNGSYRKVAIVEDFFDIIYSVHVDLEGRPGKHAGQKRTYRTITETFAFLPREAVTHFLAGCHACQRRPRSPQSGPSPSLLTPSPSPTPVQQQFDQPKPAPNPPANYQQSFEKTLTDLTTKIRGGAGADDDDVQDNKLSSTTFKRTSATPERRTQRFSKTHLLLKRAKHERADANRPCDLSFGARRSDGASARLDGFANGAAVAADREDGARGLYDAGTSSKSTFSADVKTESDASPAVGPTRHLCRDIRGHEFDLNMPITHALLRHVPPSGQQHVSHDVYIYNLLMMQSDVPELRCMARRLHPILANVLVFGTNFARP